jgi:N-formylglutamate amidohydrolase
MKHRCRLIGENGNIFNLMGIVSKTLKEAGESEKAEEMIQRITNQAKSYDEALAMLMEYVDIE